MPPEEYLIFEDFYDGSYRCLLGIRGTFYPHVILGPLFLRSFISVYDFENKIVGLALHKNSKATITKRSMKPWLIAVISVSSVIALIIVVMVILKIRKNRKA